MSTTTLQVISAAANISQILLVIGLYVAWRQLSTAIKDIDLRSRREAGMFAIEESDRFAEKMIPACDIILKNGGLTSISNKFEQFVPLEIHAVNLQKYKDRLEQIHKNQDLHEKIRSLANTIESFSTSFMKGLADEQVIFEAVGPVYCEIIEDFWFFYCHYRRSNPENLSKILPYQNTVNLYIKWKKRIEKLGLESSRRELTKKTKDMDDEIKDATIKSLPVKTLGTF